MGETEREDMPLVPLSRRTPQGCGRSWPAPSGAPLPRPARSSLGDGSQRRDSRRTRAMRTRVRTALRGIGGAVAVMLVIGAQRGRSMSARLSGRLMLDDAKLVACGIAHKGQVNFPCSVGTRRVLAGRAPTRQPNSVPRRLTWAAGRLTNVRVVLADRPAAPEARTPLRCLPT
jgi:hypothetical protein